jgi:peptide/nickel transport system ATP-binding protein
LLVGTDHVWDRPSTPAGDGTSPMGLLVQPSPLNTNLVDLEEVKVYFWVRKGLLRTQAVRAVDGVSLSLKRGDVVSVVGESGSGKTTLGRASLRLVKPTSGRVLFDGRDITSLPENELKTLRRRAQAIFQDPFSSIDPFMTVYDTVEEPLLIHGIGPTVKRRERVVQALRDVRLVPPEEIGDRYPHLLSGGQRQRVGTARTLVLQPEYIVADEPVSMIDASSRAELLYLLRGLRERFGITFLYITHDIATARHFAQRIVVMYLGLIVESGPAAAVVENPLHPYSRALIAAVPEPDPANRLRERPVLPGEPPSSTQVPTGCSFHPRCPSYMRGTCETNRPRLVEAEPEHYVACYLHPGVQPGSYAMNHERAVPNGQCTDRRPGQSVDRCSLQREDRHS